MKSAILAREAGFTIAETRTFVTGFSANTPPAMRWRTLAQRKLVEIDAQVARLEHMRELLESSFRCQCLSIEDCVRFIAARSVKRQSVDRDVPQAKLEAVVPGRHPEGSARILRRRRRTCR